MEDSVQDKAIFLERFTFKFEQIHSCNSQDIYMEESETQSGESGAWRHLSSNGYWRWSSSLEENKHLQNKPVIQRGKTSGSEGHQNEFDLSRCNFSSDPSAGLWGAFFTSSGVHPAIQLGKLAHVTGPPKHHIPFLRLRLYFRTNALKKKVPLQRVCPLISILGDDFCKHRVALAVNYRRKESKFLGKRWGGGCSCGPVLDHGPALAN